MILLYGRVGKYKNVVRNGMINLIRRRSVTVKKKATAENDTNCRAGN